MPAVLMSRQHRQSCRVFVGDAMPGFSLPSLDGKKGKLADRYGQALTVVCFFSDGYPPVVQELRDLEPEVAARYAARGVQVVGVACRQPRDAVARLVKKSGDRFAILLDEDGKAFGRLATGFGPRTYLLDASGKILWLDLEYSATTRRQLAQAIQYALEHAK